jgi:hypothetical protein
MFLRGEEMPKREPEMIYFLHEWMTVAEVEKRCRADYRVFDNLRSIVRIAINAGDAYISPQRAVGLVRRHPTRCRNHPGRT